MTQSAYEELTERIVEAAPTKVIPSLLAIRNFQNSSKDHRRRLNEGYAASMKLAGFETKSVEEEEEDMGAISVTGDNTYNITVAPQTEEGVASSDLIPSIKNNPSLMKKALPVVGAGLVGAALATTTLNTLKPTEVPETPEVPQTVKIGTDTQYKFGLGKPQ